MSINFQGFRLMVTALFAVALIASQSSVRGADKPAELETVELFEAVKAGKIETRYVAKDAQQGNLLVKNLTDQPLNVVVPEAFGAVPVLAQFGGGMGGGGMGGGGMGGGGMGGMGGGGGGGGQAMGGGGGGGMGGMGGGGMGGGGMGGGGGMFRVAPEKLTKIVARTVCLEHGKLDPTPAMAYNVVPIEQVTKDEKVVELCKMVSNREIPTNVAQAAAWNIANEISWQELAALDRIKSKYTGSVKYFSSQELQLAFRVASEAGKRASSQREPKSKNTYTSVSNSSGN